MSRLYDTVEPSVINEEMLLVAVTEQGARNQATKNSVNEDGLEFDQVQELRLDFRS